jgi:hypothetical protein
MTRRIRVPVSVAGTLLAALAFAAPSPAAVVRGTVVHRNVRTHSFVVASRTGHLTKVRTRHAARVGRVVRVSGHAMRDGSIAARHIRSGARQRTARLRGTVTFANRRAGRFTVSSRAGSISVRRGAGARAASDDVPDVGTQVVVTITVQPGGVLEEDGVDELGMDQQVEIEGIVMSITGQAVTISASDDDTAAGQVTVTFPAGFDLSGVTVGNEVELKAIRQADGTFVLSKLETGDENDLADEADNEHDNQQGHNNDDGDNHDDQGDSGDGGGD